MDCLYVVVRRHKENELPSAGDAMQVDSITDLPALSPFLSTCITYGTTPAALRVAMRRSLKDADDILAVMKVLEMWINQWSKRDVKLLPSKKEVSKNEHGVQVLKKKGKEINKDLPPLNKVHIFVPTSHSFVFTFPFHRFCLSSKLCLTPPLLFFSNTRQHTAPCRCFLHTSSMKLRSRTSWSSFVGPLRRSLERRLKL